MTQSFGDLAIELGHTTARLVGRAQERQRSLAREGRRVFLAEILVSSGAITPTQGLALLDRGQGYRESTNHDGAPMPFGDVAVRKGYISPAELFGALLQQRDEDATSRPHRFVGDILVDRRQLSLSGLTEVLAAMETVPRASAPEHELYGGGELHARRSCRVAAFAARSIREIMSHVVLTIPSAPLGSVLDAMDQADSSVALVLEGRSLRGIIDLWDVQEIERAILVGRIMRDFEPTVPIEATLADVTRTLAESGLPSLAVIAGHNAVGAITRDDLRRVGVSAEELGEIRIPYEELGVVD